MALFFDGLWFDTKLSALKMSRADLAAHADISSDDLILMFKDQMEVSADIVGVWADLLGESHAEIATRCGMSTPMRAPRTQADRITDLEARVARLEFQIQECFRQPDAKS